MTSIVARQPLFGLAVSLLLLAGTVAGANELNPEISVIGDTRATWTEDSDPETTLGLDEVEIAIVGPVSPYASAEIFIGYHDEQFELEEARLTLDRWLPGGFGLTVGGVLLLILAYRFYHAWVLDGVGYAPHRAVDAACAIAVATEELVALRDIFVLHRVNRASGGGVD